MLDLEGEICTEELVLSFNGALRGFLSDNDSFAKPALHRFGFGAVGSSSRGTSCLLVLTLIHSLYLIASSALSSPANGCFGSHSSPIPKSNAG